MTKQLQFTCLPKQKLIHGGELSKGKRKIERPLKLNKPIHVVLRAKRSGLKTKERRIQKIIEKFERKFSLKVYRTSINSNHIHLLVVVKRRRDFQNFLRSITGLIARVMGTGKLWEYLAFSRVANWGKEYQVLVKYIHKNQLEALGMISYTPRTG
jgi:REP element-mobilizing transposase RayT